LIDTIPRQRVPAGLLIVGCGVGASCVAHVFSRVIVSGDDADVRSRRPSFLHQEYGHGIAVVNW
jgi:hypothetical protein